MTRTRRRRLMLLSASVLGAGCSRGEAAPKDALGSDPALVARLQRDSVRLAAAPATPTDGAAVCRQPSSGVEPASAQRQHDADLQLQLAREAELAGDRRGTRDALRRAARLDPTNDVIARRLARASEALGDASSAIEEYCRVLALAPSPADSAAASERLRALAAYPAASAATPATPATPAASAPPLRVASARPPATEPRRARPATRPAASRPMTPTPASTVTPSGNVVTVTAHGALDRPRAADTTRQVAVADSAVAAPAAPQETSSVPSPPDTGAATAPPQRPAPEVQPAADQPAPQPARRGGVSGRSVLTGAAVGAVLGAAVGRDVRGAVIGAAAGGVLGSVVRPRYRPGSTVPRGISGWGGE